MAVDWRLLIGYTFGGGAGQRNSGFDRSAFMSEAKMAILVRKVHQRTRGRMLKWMKTSRDGVYEAEFSAFNVRIIERRVTQSILDHVMQVCDKNGVTVEEVHAEKFGRPEPAHEIATALREIYVGAMSIAMGPSDAIDSILDEL